MAELFQWGIGVAGFLLACTELPELHSIPPWLLLYWFVMATLLEAMPVPLGKMLVSLIAAIPIGVAIAYGGAAAMWVMVIAELCAPFIPTRRSRWTNSVFNAGQYAISTWVLTFIVRILAPTGTAVAAGVHLFFAGLAGAVGFFLVNHLFIQVCAWLWGRLSWSSALEVACWDGISYLIALPFDVVMVALKSISPLISAVAVLPIVLLGQLLRMYRRMTLMQQVHELTGRLAAEFDIDRICEEAARLAMKLTDADSTAIFTLDEKGEILLPNAVYPTDTSVFYRLDGWRQQDGGLVWQVAHETGTVYIPDSQKDSRLRPDNGLPQRFRSLALVPLRARGNAHGVLLCCAANIAAFRGTLEYVSALAAQVAVLLENAKLYQELQELSWRDGVTGLYNHRFFYQALHDWLRTASERGLPLSIAIVDVDLFKQFNDTYGHLAGDAVLRSVANLLVDLAGPEALVARYGGEEFALILPADVEEAGMILERIRESVSRHVVDYDGQRLEGITVSCGYATFPHHGRRDRDLLRKADLALYWGGKWRGRNRVAVYSPEFDPQRFSSHTPSALDSY
ncbi:sensor domain-containing diguanylate cyclase [Alicyclobacillus herbarius]|uniref:sensor domain-containing diguanylate cyclase n=1 Tax=Alicyclobacillus herbarius TaxID=122960 RepID=UPI000412A705|nr:sensor domain-containing diguanylate cyclase [Alicyclobacillus herbarius]